MSVRNNLYPHLLPQDIDVWIQFLAEHSSEYQYFDYDVRIGDGRDPGTLVEEKYRRMAIQLSQRRIDAVGHAGDHLDIIEITVDAGIHAIGQLQTYPLLYQQTYRPGLPLRPVLVCRTISPDIVGSLRFMQITAHTYPEGD